MPSYVTALLLTFPHTELEPNYYQMSREKVSAPRRGEICGELVTSLGLHSSLLTPHSSAATNTSNIEPRLQTEQTSILNIESYHLTCLNSGYKMGSNDCFIIHFTPPPKLSCVLRAVSYKYY